MNYTTRHMVALQSMRYMGRELTPGDDFHPTEVDAGYFVKHHMAEPAPAAPQPEAAAPAPARRGRPPRAAAPAPDEPAAPAPAPAEAQAEAPAAEAKSFIMGAGDVL